jgi:hypothetical protein
VKPRESSKATIGDVLDLLDAAPYDDYDTPLPEAERIRRRDDVAHRRRQLVAESGLSPLDRIRVEVEQIRTHTHRWP